MIINFNIKNIICSKIGDISEGYLYYSNDYDKFIIIIISHCDDVDTIDYREIENLYYNSKKYAIDLFYKICLNYVFVSKEI